MPEMHGGGVGFREVDGPAATGVPDGARQVARTPEMPDDAAPLIVDLYPRTIVGCLGGPVADELEGCADRQARLAVVVHAPRVTAVWSAGSRQGSQVGLPPGRAGSER